MTTSREDFEALMPEPKYRIRSVLGRHIDIKAEGYDARKDDPLYTADQMRAMFEAATERAAKVKDDEIAHIRNVRNESAADMRREIELLREFHSFFQHQGEALFAHFGMEAINLYNACALNPLSTFEEEEERDGL